MENKILYFATPEVECRWTEEKCNKSCNLFCPWKNHPLLKEEAIKSLNPESLHCFSSIANICKRQKRMFTPRAMSFVLHSSYC